MTAPQKRHPTRADSLAKAQAKVAKIDKATEAKDEKSKLSNFVKKELAKPNPLTATKKTTNLVGAKKPSSKSLAKDKRKRKNKGKPTQSKGARKDALRIKSEKKK